MAAAIRGYKMVLIMPEDLSMERRQSMAAYGAEIILTPVKGGMEYARDLADSMERDGRGVILDQFANPDNPLAHYETTGPEIWRDTEGRITHFVSAMGTTGTITGVSRYLKEQNAGIQIVGAQPAEGSRIPGIRKWPEAYMPKIYDPKFIDRTEPVSQGDAEHMARRMAREEGSSAASRLPVRCVSRCVSPRKWRMPPSCSWCAIAVIATFRPGCSRPDAALHRALKKPPRV